jgi:hypothetical protein
VKLEKRLRAVEAKMSSNPTILHFADGTEKKIYGRKDYLLQLFIAASGQNLSPRDAKNLDLILKCKRSEERGGGRLVEAIKSVFVNEDEVTEN